MVPTLKAPRKEDNPKKKRQPNNKNKQQTSTTTNKQKTTTNKKKPEVQENKITSMFPKILKTIPPINEDNHQIEDNPEKQTNKGDGPKRYKNASKSKIAHQAKQSEYGDATCLNSVKVSSSTL